MAFQVRRYRTKQFIISLHTDVERLPASLTAGAAADFQRMQELVAQEGVVRKSRTACVPLLCINFADGLQNSGSGLGQGKVYYV